MGSCSAIQLTEPALTRTQNTCATAVVVVAINREWSPSVASATQPSALVANGSHGPAAVAVVSPASALVHVASVTWLYGILFVDAVPVSEPYIVGKCDWNYDEKPVEEGKVFVVGDNRLVPMESHDFGEVSKSRIAGRLIW